MNHPWFYTDEDELSQNDLARGLKELRAFNAKRKLRAGIDLVRKVKCVNSALMFFSFSVDPFSFVVYLISSSASSCSESEYSAHYSQISLGCTKGRIWLSTRKIRRVSTFRQYPHVALSLLLGRIVYFGSLQLHLSRVPSIIGGFERQRLSGIEIFCYP